MSTYTRRHALAVVAGASFAGSRAWAANDPWLAVYPQILKRIQPPKFPEKDFDVTRYGAKTDGKTDCTAAFRKAIEEASRAGGGRVVVREGVCLTGAIHLRTTWPGGPGLPIIRPESEALPDGAHAEGMEA
jgi:polygalacturonase